MKKIIAIVVVAIVAGLALWMLLPQSEPWPGEDGSTASKPDRVVNPQADTPSSAAVAPETGHMSTAERARLLAAIAAKIAQAENPEVVVDGGAVASQPLPRDREWRTQIKSFQRGTTRKLQPLVRECLAEARKTQPGLATPSNRAVLTVESAPGVGSAVTKVEVLGPNGPIAAPTLQSCLQNQAFSLKLDAAPHAEGAPNEPSVFTYTLMAAEKTPMAD